MVRITVTLDDALMEEARQALGTETTSETICRALEEAVRRHRLNRVLDHAGKIDLDIDRDRLERLRETLPTFQGDGTQPGVDLDDTSALLDRMDDLDAG